VTRKEFCEYKSVGSAWHKDSIVAFNLPEWTLQKRYDLFINVRDNMIINSTICFFVALELQMDLQSRYT
jgi:hypothetical protein